VYMWCTFDVHIVYMCGVVGEECVELNC